MAGAKSYKVASDEGARHASQQLARDVNVGETVELELGREGAEELAVIAAGWYEPAEGPAKSDAGASSGGDK